MDSIWIKSEQLPRFDRQPNDINTDVLIIGGGIAGLLCAYALHQAGVDYRLVEAKEICSGVTGNTTAKVTVQHGLIYHDIISRYGLEAARRYYRANQQALERYRTLCEHINCAFETQDAFVYSLDSRKKIAEEVEAYRSIGVSAEFVSELPLPFSVAGAVKIGNQAQFHPLRFLSAVVKDLKIWEHTKVQQLQPGLAVTDCGNIRWKKAIVATHFPMLNKHGQYFVKLYQHRSYVLALENAPRFHGMYVDEKDSGLSFRHYGDLLLLGGGGHRTGKKGGNWRELSAFAEKHFPQAREVARWATQDCMSLDGMPYIGQYSKSTPDLYVATGFNKWGMTSSMVAAMVLADLVQGKENPYTELFSPSRSMLHPQLAANVLESTVGLLTPTVPRCPHMGCALKYNRQEHSWDCPCHGSRFDANGQLLDNPATDDKRIK